MKIPKYWAMSEQAATQDDGAKLRLATWQWSDDSVADAKQKADARLLTLVLKVAAGEDLNRYGYDERPLREEIMQPVASSTGSEIGVITRNLYGALVLNALNAMFIDIDFPENNGGAATATAVKRLLGGKAPSVPEAALQRIEMWASARPELGMRIYRTFGGLRCLITNQLFDPSKLEAMDILKSLGSDPLYMRLCKSQECFRARLTPKPWRCDLRNPPFRYPRTNAGAEREFREWQGQYEHTSAQRAVCKFIKQVGPDAIHPDVAPILALHDGMTHATSALALA